jgi:aspartyl-tRNA(Asn)/glutamyl-tRNA(Gln) amidotransferase subunit C
MATLEEVKKLAALARISVSDSEVEKFAVEFDAILAYVGQLEKLDVKKSGSLLPYVNVMREDGEPHEKGKYTDTLVEQFPQNEGNYLSVKQIISHD